MVFCVSRLKYSIIYPFSEELFVVGYEVKSTFVSLLDDVVPIDSETSGSMFL